MSRGTFARRARQDENDSNICAKRRASAWIAGRWMQGDTAPRAASRPKTAPFAGPATRVQVCNRWQPSRRRVGPVTCILQQGWPYRLAASSSRMRVAAFARANDLLLCVRPAANVRMARASRCVLSAFSAAGERIPVERCFFRAVSSFAYWRRAAVALHFALPTGSADPTPPTNTEHITHGKNRR